jgi:succinoglycan biosynthesis transport protein ExoP
MKADDETLFDILRILKTRMRPALIAAFAVLLAMTCLVFLLPAVYESRATLLIEQMDIPVELTGDLGTQQYVEQRLQRTRQRVLTDENVKNLIKTLNVYDTSGDESDLDAAVDMFHENVFITPQVTGVIDPRTMRAAELTYAFDVGFWHSTPETATNVAREVADLFIKSSAAQATEDARRAIEFAKTESERLAGELRIREARLTEFREKNPGGLPEDRVRNQDRALALERELAAIDADLRAARGRRDLLSAQLAATPRDNTLIDENGQVVMGGSDRLAQAQQELVAALAKYSDNHPDVRRLRREIATLKVEVGGKPTSPPTNPAYAQLQTQVGAADIESRALGARRHSVSQQLAALEGENALSPRLEEKYRELVRDYEVMKTQYEQMRARQANAELQAKAASGAAVAESYVLVNPARVPDAPIEPDRLALMFLSLVLAIAAGLGTAYFLHMTDSTVRGSSDVVALTGQHVFAHIPTMRSATEERRMRVNDFALATAIVVVAVIVLYLVN